MCAMDNGMTSIADDISLAWTCDECTGMHVAENYLASMAETDMLVSVCMPCFYLTLIG